MFCVQFLFYLNHYLVDFDTRVARPKLPKTALPSDIREKLGLKKREDKYRPQKDCGNDLKTLEKKPYLKRGTRKMTEKLRNPNVDKKAIHVTVKNPLNEAIVHT